MTITFPRHTWAYDAFCEILVPILSGDKQAPPTNQSIFSLFFPAEYPRPGLLVFFGTNSSWRIRTWFCRFIPLVLWTKYPSHRARTRNKRAKERLISFGMTHSTKKAWWNLLKRVAAPSTDFKDLVPNQVLFVWLTSPLPWYDRLTLIF